MSLRLRLLIRLHHLVVKPAVAGAQTPVLLRDFFERGARQLFRAPPGTAVTETQLAPGLDALRIRARPATAPLHPRRAILYFHGGAFIAGSPQTHAAMLARLSRLTRTEVIAPRWRLAPEHSFPAGPDDALAAFDALLARGLRAEDIVLGGDSAGGNLALGLLARLLDQGTPPAGLFAISPVTDLTFSGPSFRANAASDSALPASQSQKIQDYYLQGADPTDPRASPLFADYPGAPPVFLQVSDTEILRDDSLRLAEKLRAGGARVTLDRWPDAPHVLVLFEAWVPEARAGLARIAGFVAGLYEARAKAGAETSR